MLYRCTPARCNRGTSGRREEGKENAYAMRRGCRRDGQGNTNPPQPSSSPSHAHSAGAEVVDSRGGPQIRARPQRLAEIAPTLGRRTAPALGYVGRRRLSRAISPPSRCSRRKRRHQTSPTQPNPTQRTHLGEAPLLPHVASGPHLHPPLVGPRPRLSDVVPVDAVVPSRHGAPAVGALPTRPIITMALLDFASVPPATAAAATTASTAGGLESLLREGKRVEAGVAGEGVPPGEQL